jgi:Lon-like protease
MPPARKVLKVGVPLAVVAAVVVSGTVWLPLYSLQPGPPRDVETLIQVTGHPEYASSGRFVMTSVIFRQLTPLGALFAWLDPHVAVVPRSDLFSPGETGTQEHRRAISQMDQSKLDAIYAVLSELTSYPKRHADGALVESVVPGCAADGVLYPGDLIHSIDGTPIRGAASASRAIEAAPSGSSLTFVLTVDGQRQTEHLVRRPCGGKQRPLVGVSLISAFPFGVTIESGDVGGPSAGLMWALGLYDLLTPGDLTGGRTIAGTGQIGVDGTVYPIGGVAEKVVAAERAGADAFLVPKGDLSPARAADADGMKIVPVSTLRDALDWLQEGSSS